MNREEFRAFLNLLMCSDGLIDNDADYILKNFADNEARKYGYENWIEAYHSKSGVYGICEKQG